VWKVSRSEAVGLAEEGGVEEGGVEVEEEADPERKRQCV
jgi:hypothetical protein